MKKITMKAIQAFEKGKHFSQSNTWGVQWGRQLYHTVLY